MEAVVEVPALEAEHENVIVTDLPREDEFVACEQCPHKDHDGKPWGMRSYMFFYYGNGLLAFCKHHGEANQAKLEEAGGVLVMDTRYRLVETRTKE